MRFLIGAQSNETLEILQTEVSMSFFLTEIRHSGAPFGIGLWYVVRGELAVVCICFPSGTNRSSPKMSQIGKNRGGA